MATETVLIAVTRHRSIDAMSHGLIVNSRRLVTAAVAFGLLPGAAHAAPIPKPLKCDPKLQVCDTGRKNG